jgi:hypothetical protein
MMPSIPSRLAINHVFEARAWIPPSWRTAFLMICNTVRFKSFSEEEVRFENVCDYPSI